MPSDNKEQSAETIHRADLEKYVISLLSLVFSFSRLYACLRFGADLLVLLCVSFLGLF